LVVIVFVRPSLLPAPTKPVPPLVPNDEPPEFPPVIVVKLPDGIEPPPSLCVFMVRVTVLVEVEPPSPPEVIDVKPPVGRDTYFRK
jgi:hypothetical protein